MDLVVIPGYQQEPESSPLEEVSTVLDSYFFSIKYIEWPQDEYNKKIYERTVLSKLENKSVILGHSLGATIGLSLLSEPEVVGMIALDPISKAIDSENNKLEVDRVSSEKPLLVFDSGSEQIDIPKGNFERKNIDSNHFFENSEEKIKNLASNWVKENV